MRLGLHGLESIVCSLYGCVRLHVGVGLNSSNLLRRVLLSACEVRLSSVHQLVGLIGGLGQTVGVAHVDERLGLILDGLDGSINRGCVGLTRALALLVVSSSSVRLGVLSLLGALGSADGLAQVVDGALSLRGQREAVRVREAGTLAGLQGRVDSL